MIKGKPSKSVGDKCPYIGTPNHWPHPQKLKVGTCKKPSWKSNRIFHPPPFFGGFHISIYFHRFFFRRFVSLLRVGLQKHWQVKTDLANLLGDDSWLPSSFTKNAHRYSYILQISNLISNWRTCLYQIKLHGVFFMSYYTDFISVPWFCHTIHPIHIIYRSGSGAHVWKLWRFLVAGMFRSPRKTASCQAGVCWKLGALRSFDAEKTPSFDVKITSSDVEQIATKNEKTSTKARGDGVLPRLPYLFLYQFRCVDDWRMWFLQSFFGWTINFDKHIPHYVSFKLRVHVIDPFGILWWWEKPSAHRNDLGTSHDWLHENMMSRSFMQVISASSFWESASKKNLESID